MIRSASFLPMPGIDTSTAWSAVMIASWRSAIGRDPTIARATLGPTLFTVSSRLKNPSSSAVLNPYSACWSSRTRWYVCSFSRPPATAAAMIAGAANTR